MEGIAPHEPKAELLPAEDVNKDVNSLSSALAKARKKRRYSIGYNVSFGVKRGIPMVNTHNYDDWSREELIQQILLLGKRKKYGLVWDEERTQEQFEQDAQGSLPVLTEVADKAIHTDPDKPTHILIEGDNYHALSVLNYTHENSVDVIFIDPPYNKGIKGSNDFRYNDRYVDHEDAFRHSKWISFMSKRLLLARNLLKETGVIFITIDDNEAHHLRMILNEVFDESNFIANIVWQKKQSPQNDATYFSDMHDHIIVFAKRAKQNRNDPHGWQLYPLPRTEKQDARASNPDNDPRGDWISVDYTCNKTAEQRPNLYYPIVNPNTGEEVWPSKQRVWRYEKATHAKNAIENRVWWGSSGNNFPRLKRFIKDLGQGVVPSTWWGRTQVGDNQEARRELRSIFQYYGGELAFETPKPVRLIKQILSVATANSGDEVIVDFFAGSGTTLHAVLEMNELDDGFRQCILVTDNENNIMTEVCYPRVQRVMEGYEYQGKDKALLFKEKMTLTRLKKADKVMAAYQQAREENQAQYDELRGEFKDNTVRLWGITNIDSWKEGLGGNLRYYRTAFVPAEPTDDNKETLTRRSVEMLCLRENTFDFVTETDLWKIYESQIRYTGILFDQLAIPDFKEVLADLDKPVSVYVFSLGDDNFALEFADMDQEVTVRSIPEAILRVYRRIYRS